MKSIISNKKICIICGTPLDLHKHHVFYGTSNRKNSERYGCWVYLCSRHHNMSDEGVHFNKELDNFLKKASQLMWEKEYGTREEFMQIFSRNYI